MLINYLIDYFIIFYAVGRINYVNNKYLKTKCYENLIKKKI